MKSKNKKRKDQDLYQQSLEFLLDQRQPLYKLANAIPWEVFEEEFGQYYAEGGRPAKPIRLMTGLLILKSLEDLSDEVLIERWKQNPYYQHFCGESFFQWDFPCHPTDLVYFRKRIGFNGVQKVLEVSANIHGGKCREKTVVIDTTVQEKNITFPTDTKLYYRIIQHLWRLADDAGIQFYHSYKRTVPKLRNILKTRSNRLVKERKRARRKLKTLAGRLFRELCRKLSSEWLEVLEDDLNVYEQILNQKKTDKNKIYSVHEPDVYCIGKGKVHKKWEFGSKVGIAVTATTGIITGMMSFEENLYDGDTLEDMLYQIKRITGQEPETA